MNREGPFPAPTAGDLAEFEQRHSITLPDAYRSFLLAFAGGPPEGCDVRVPLLKEDRTLREVYPLRCTRDEEGIGTADLEGVMDWDEFFPRELLAIADDGYGSWFCLGIRGALAGGVFYVSHDLDQSDRRRIAPVADSFEQFTRKWKLPKRPRG